ncbi:patatin-like phospholipase family protein [Burkholderia sp. BCC0405]|uniref:patatin-like phospholipase family protein n=1 Tax=Burkholderia sp. BCC0405 TaxID=2676298 RepID=UPI00158B6EDF|nr:patatin-like phospholipase family protein [Burkholderia sp. BCC0405]
MWVRGVGIVALIVGSLWASAVNAGRAPVTSPQEAEQAGVTAARPRVCLALSGGGARGYAHLGVLKQLEAMHVPVDCIAGTSMGAVIGSLYASGMSADAIEQVLTKFDLSDVAFDREARRDLPQSSREDNFMYPISLPMGFGDGRLKLPSGLVQGSQLLALLQAYLGRIPGDVDFDRLPIPFRAVATDLETGERVVLRQGSLPLAVRASMAIPGLFTPAKIAGRTLTDGGISSNLPIDVAREMGADVVIAVDVGTPIKRADQLDSIPAVTSQVIRLMMMRNVIAQKATLRPSDIQLEPDLGSISLTDFGTLAQGVGAGAASAREHRAQLEALSIEGAQYASWRASLPHDVELPSETRIAKIDVATRGRVPADRVVQALRIKPGDVYEPSAVSQDLTRLASDMDLESVSQTLTGPADNHVLHVDANEKSWGPNFLSFGVGLSTDFNGDGGFTLQMGHRLPWITQSGLSWRNDIVLGNKDLGWHTELRQPVLGEIYLAPYAAIRRNNVNLYVDNDVNKRPSAALVQQDIRVGMDLGVPLGNWGEVRGGIARVRTSWSPRSSALSVVDIGDGAAELRADDLSLSSSTQTVASLGLTIDQLDDPVFPRSGIYFNTRAEMGLGGEDSRYDIARASGLWATSRGPFSVNAAFELGGQIGPKRELPAYLFSLGGFQRLSAYPQDKFSGAYIMYGRLTGLAQISKGNSGPLRGVFAGLSLEGGNVWNESRQFARGPWLSSASTFLGTVTAIGPVYLGFAVAPHGVRSVYFQLGNRF